MLGAGVIEVVSVLLGVCLMILILHLPGRMRSTSRLVVVFVVKVGIFLEVRVHRFLRRVLLCVSEFVQFPEDLRREEGDVPGDFFHVDRLIVVGLVVGHFKDSVVDSGKLLQDFIEDNGGVFFGVAELVADENVGHPLGDELKALYKVLVLVEFLLVVLVVDFFLPRLFFYFREDEVHVLIGPLLDLGCDGDVGDGRPGEEEVVQKLLELLH